MTKQDSLIPQQTKSKAISRPVRALVRPPVSRRILVMHARAITQLVRLQHRKVGVPNTIHGAAA